MFNIRNGSWETNSSSVHVLVIPKETTITIPKKVILYGGDFGWGEGTASPLDYVYQVCVDEGREQLDRFFEYLKRKGVEEIHSPELHWVEEEWCGEKHVYAENNPGYVDHSYEVPLDDMFFNEDLLDRFLFGEGSFVKTGNDNGDNCPKAEDYDPNIYDTIEKGN